MNTTTPQLTPAPAQSAPPAPIAQRTRGSDSPDRPIWGELSDASALIIGAPAFFGPPIAFVLGPWLLLVLVLIGPFALILTVVLALALAWALLAVLVAVIAGPYLLIRHLHARGIADAKPRPPLHPFQTRRVSSGRLGSPQPRGMS